MTHEMSSEGWPVVKEHYGDGYGFQLSDFEITTWPQGSALDELLDGRSARMASAIADPTNALPAELKCRPSGRSKFSGPDCATMV